MMMMTMMMMTMMMMMMMKSTRNCPDFAMQKFTGHRSLSEYRKQCRNKNITHTNFIVAIPAPKT
eukprot:185060-Karenia_brevis.AAC.1